MTSPLLQHYSGYRKFEAFYYLASCEPLVALLALALHRPMSGLGLDLVPFVLTLLALLIHPGIIIKT